MKKIFIYNGSNYRLSTSGKYIDILMNKISEQIEIEYDFYTPRNTDVKYCEGCGVCFDIGNCVIDKKDDMKIIKDKMFNADLLIFATPIYMHNVSAPFKNFIDRTSYWCHLFKLAGKPVINVISTATNGVEKVMPMLDMYTRSLGLLEIKKVILTDMNNHCDVNLNDSVNSIVDIFEGREPMKTHPGAEALFKVEKNIFIRYPESNAEYKYWKERKLFEYNSLQDYITNEIRSKDLATIG